MTISALMQQPCTVYTVTATTAVDDRGDAVTTAVARATTCQLEQTRTAEPSKFDGSVNFTTWTAFLPADVETVGADYMTISGVRYDFLGDANPVVNARTGLVHHVEASLTRRD